MTATHQRTESQWQAPSELALGTKKRVAHGRAYWNPHAVFDGFVYVSFLNYAAMVVVRKATGSAE